MPTSAFGPTIPTRRLPGSTSTASGLHTVAVPNLTRLTSGAAMQPRGRLTSRAASGIAIGSVVMLLRVPRRCQSAPGRASVVPDVPAPVPFAVVATAATLT